jgi:hypothetical protein
MTRERYFEVCKQLGQEPDPDEIPPDAEDFPDEAIQAMTIYRELGDRVVSDIGFIGKDYTNLPVLIEVYEVEDKELLMGILSELESRAIKQSQEELKREREKLKRRSRGIK